MTRALRCFVASFIVVVCLIPVKRVRAQSRDTRSGVSSVIHAFDSHSIVLLGELHWNVEEHRFIQQLLSDPRLPTVVDDIAVEFGSSRYQGMIDRYVAGENVPVDSLRLAWRNTTQPLAWDRPIYADVYSAVRRINKTLPRNRRMRLIALDPPIDWAKVQSVEDFPRIWGYRDPVWFQTLESEVLSKKRKVLVIAGGLHILRRDPPDFQPKTFDRLGLGDALAQRYPQQTFRIFPVAGDGPLAKLVRGNPRETLVPVAGTPFGARNAQIFWDGSVTMFRKVNGVMQPYTLSEKDFPSIESLVDAVMYFGPHAQSAPLPIAQYADAGYVNEIRRRVGLVSQIFGLDQSALIDSLAKAAQPRSRQH